ncbi:MAG: hypothetical protein ACI30J_08160 [Paludibacteraceae bacterium]
MKELLEDIVRSVTSDVRAGHFTVDYRNKAFVRVIMHDGLQVDFHKFGDVCLTYRGDGTLEAYLLAKKKAIVDEMNSKSDEMAVLRKELKEVDEQLRKP